MSKDFSTGVSTKISVLTLFTGQRLILRSLALKGDLPAAIYFYDDSSEGVSYANAPHSLSKI